MLKRLFCLTLATGLAIAVGACATTVPEPAETAVLPPTTIRPQVSEKLRTRPVLDVHSVPGLDAAGRKSYARFLTFPAPRAFAIGAAGGLAWTAAAPSTEAAIHRAMSQCRTANHDQPCQLYARDQQVIGGAGIEDEALPAPIAERGWTLAAPAGFLRHEHEAEGVILWTHGRGRSPLSPVPTDPQPFVQRFNNAGWDVWVLARDPGADVTFDQISSFADQALRQAATRLRGMGYRRVVAAGQSAGGWAALAALDTPGLLDGAVVIAGAGLYQPPPGQHGTLDFQRLLSRVRDRAAPVAIAMFAGDPLLPWPDRSAAMLREAFAPRSGKLLLIDRPAGLHGHGGGAEPLFNDRFGDCILRVIAEGAAPICP